MQDLSVLGQSADRSICYSFHSASASDKTDRGEVLQSGEAEDERRESDRTACTGDRRHRYDKGQRAGRDPGPNLVGEDG